MKVIKILPERDKNIVMKYYGFIDNKSMSMSEIADELDLSVDVVSNIIHKALVKISNALNTKKKQQHQKILIKNTNTK